MTRNTLGDLHNLLMEEMERLSDVDPEDVDVEVKRAHAMAQVATAVNNNAVTIIRANKLSQATKVPRILGDGN